MNRATWIVVGLLAAAVIAAGAVLWKHHQAGDACNGCALRSCCRKREGRK